MKHVEFGLWRPGEARLGLVAPGPGDGPAQEGVAGGLWACQLIDGVPEDYSRVASTTVILSVPFSNA